MINVLLSGCNGHMGQSITKLSKTFEGINIAAGYDKNNTIQNSYPVFTNLSHCDKQVDVIIDFSNPVVFDALVDYSVTRKIPLVMATTGLSKEQIETLHEAAKNIPVFFTSNMSLGVNLIMDLVKKAASILQYNYDIEIIEKHHNQKVDAPSGTALSIADAISEALDEPYDYVYDRHLDNQKRSKKEIGFHAVRGGTIVGDHSVIFAGNDEVIEINHSATSKDVFATGALNAAKFIANKKPGLYNMKDLINNE